jgi:hypothetical protein
MRSADGAWQSPPPPWPLIGSDAVDAFDVPELLDAGWSTLVPPVELGELCELIESGGRAHHGWAAAR